MKGLLQGKSNRNFSSVFADRPSFRAKGLLRGKSNRNFTSVFADRPSFRAKGLLQDKSNRNFNSVFADRPSFRAKGLAFRDSPPAPPSALREKDKKKARERRCEDEQM